MPALTSIWGIPPLLGGLLQTFFSALTALAVFMVIFGIFKFIIHADDETERAKGRWAILWGIVGLFLMFSIWGLVYLLVNTFGLQHLGGAPVINQGAIVPQYRQ